MPLRQFRCEGSHPGPAPRPTGLSLPGIGSTARTVSWIPPVVLCRRRPGGVASPASPA